MAQSEVDEVEVDQSLKNSLTRATSGCVSTTITPGACGGRTGTCTLTFYRTSTFLGITLSTNDKYTLGFNGFTNIPTSVRFATMCHDSNGTIIPQNCPYKTTGNTNGILAAAYVTVSGITGVLFYQSRTITTFTSAPIIGRSTITFGVHSDSSNVNHTVNLANIISNGGNTVSMGRPGFGAITVNLCTPTVTVSG
ncbi:unnamed protein product, partial [Rotaria magnacalcarata]